MNALTPPSMATEHTSMSASEPSQTAAESDFAPDSAESVDTQKVATAALTPIESMAPLVTKVPVETSSSAKFSEDLPPLEGEETYASTSYKSRIIGLHIEDQLERHRNEGILGPLMVALQGPQGCG